MNKIAIYYSKQLADELKDEAQKIGIPVSEDTNLLSLAAAKIRKTVDLHNLPGGMTLDDLILGTLQRLMVREPSKGIERYNRKYVRDFFLPNVVISLKKNNVSLDKILKDRNMQKILEKFDLEKDLLERCYSGDKKPLRVNLFKDFSLSDLEDNKSRPSLFKEFKGESEPEFIKFWTTSVANAARNYLRDSADFTLDKSKRILINKEDGEDGIDESSLVDEKSHNSIEDKYQKKQLFQMLSKIDPRYEVMLDNILDTGEPNKEELKKSLGLGDSDLKSLLVKFTKDLKLVIQKMGLNRDEAARVFRAKRIVASADSIVRRYLDVVLL